MRLIAIILLTSIIPINSQVLFYNSNSSGMQLNRISPSEKGEYYIIKHKDQKNNIVKETLFKNENIKSTKRDYYNNNFKSLLKSEIIKGKSKTVSLYKNSRIITKDNFLDNKLTIKELYKYNKLGELSRVDFNNDLNEVVYSDIYHRNRDKSLRKISRTTESGYINYWYYKDGAVVETWFIDGESKVRTKVDQNGNPLEKSGYKNKELVFLESYEYNQENILIKTVKTEGFNKIESTYNTQGLVLEKNIIENGLLRKKYINEYRDGFLIKETVGGHGSIEETTYTLDTDGNPILTEIYINSKLNKRVIKDGEDSEIVEYFKDKEIYLKEFYTHKERVQRELYLDGVLFKRESISE